jgi:hypothetical protein
LDSQLDGLVVITGFWLDLLNESIALLLTGLESKDTIKNAVRMNL